MFWSWTVPLVTLLINNWLIVRKFRWVDNFQIRASQSSSSLVRFNTPRFLLWDYVKPLVYANMLCSIDVKISKYWFGNILFNSCIREYVLKMLVQVTFLLVLGWPRNQRATALRPLPALKFTREGYKIVKRHQIFHTHTPLRMTSRDARPSPRSGMQTVFTFPRAINLFSEFKQLRKWH